MSACTQISSFGSINLTIKIENGGTLYPKNPKFSIEVEAVRKFKTRKFIENIKEEKILQNLRKEYNSGYTVLC